MNYRMMCRLLGLILAAEAVFMIPALLISLFGGEERTVIAFALSIAVLLVVAAVLHLLSRKARKGFYAKEGLVSVGVSWILMSAFGCLPFVFSGDIPNYLNALFEMVSGFTTTGASVVVDVEALSRGCLYWRSFSHWVGGMGVLVFLLAIVPVSEKNDGFTMHLLRAESPGPDVGKLMPKMRKTATVLYLTYIGLTLLNFIFLLVGDMPLFDAVCTAFGTAGTGGFGIKNDSMAGYSPYIQTVTAVFMLLFGINFSCYYLILLGKLRAVFRDEELRLYLGLVGAGVLLIFLNVRGIFASGGEALRHSFFQVSSIITSTGFATVNFDLWPGFSKAILLGLMMVGACAGSTGGGLKCARLLLLIKGVRRNISQTLHPQKVQVVRVNDRAMDEKILANTNSYFAAYMLIIAVSFLVVSLDGQSLTTNLSAVISCVNNMGPGFDAVGPTVNYAFYSPIAKSVLILDMLLGRLEIFPILVLLSRHTWKRYG